MYAGATLYMVGMLLLLNVSASTVKILYSRPYLLKVAGYLGNVGQDV